MRNPAGDMAAAGALYGKRKKRKKKHSSHTPQRYTTDFYFSEEWRKLRYEVLREKGRVCACCGSKRPPFHVDHIKPRSKFPGLELVKSNLQVLCEDCNLGKGNTDCIDWEKRDT